MSNTKVAYDIAKEKYAEYGVDTDRAIERMKKERISFNAWQMDDVRGFLRNEGAMSGGILSTGCYPGAASNAEELRQDVDMAFSMIPGHHKLSLQATQADTREHIDLDQIEPKHYKSYVDWAKEKNIGLDFNPSCYSHPKSETGFTLASPDKTIRDFWIEHCKRSSRIGAYFGEELEIQAVTNLWIPDGYKDMPIDRYMPRKRLEESLNEIFEHEVDQSKNLDTIESKLFGIGVEAYTVGSNEFYISYAMKNNRALCIDAGHFHPTEEIANKISAIMSFTNEMLIHVTRPMRWDSDHVVSFDESTQEIMNEIVRNSWLGKVHLGTDYFDGSINRVAACVLGMRNTLKALVKALLEPAELLKRLELEGDYTARLVLLEELKTMPFQAVWDYYCEISDVPVGAKWLRDVKSYEKNILLNRS